MSTATLDKHDGRTIEEASTGIPLHVLPLGGSLVITTEEVGLTAQCYLDRIGITLAADEVLSLNGRVITPTTIVPASDGATNVLTISDEIGNG
jgi:hypothetical protein